MLATVQCLIPLVAGVRRRLAEYERDFPVLDRRALDRSASLLRRLERGGQRRLAPTHSFLRRLAHNAPPVDRVIGRRPLQPSPAAIGSFQFFPVFRGCFWRVSRDWSRRRPFNVLQATTSSAVARGAVATPTNYAQPFKQ